MASPNIPACARPGSVELARGGAVIGDNPRAASRRQVMDVALQLQLGVAVRRDMRSPGRPPSLLECLRMRRPSNKLKQVLSPGWLGKAVRESARSGSDKTAANGESAGPYAPTNMPGVVDAICSPHRPARMVAVRSADVTADGAPSRRIRTPTRSTTGFGGQTARSAGWRGIGLLISRTPGASNVRHRYRPGHYRAQGGASSDARGQPSRQERSAV